MSVVIKISTPEGEERIEEIELPARFGRSLECDISLHDSGISRYHFIIEREGEKILLKDLGSRNGTFLNGKEVSISTIKPGDVIRAGDTSIEVIEIDISGIFKTELSDGIDDVVKKLTGAEGYRILVERAEGGVLVESIGIDERDLEYVDSIIKSFISSKQKFLKSNDYFLMRIQTDELVGGVYLLNPTFPLPDYEILSSTLSLRAMKAEMREVKEKLRKLEKFLPRELLSSLNDDKIAFEPSLQELTVLFCDLVGFTGRCERVSAKEVFEFIKLYYKLLTDGANGNRGSVNKFLGDGGMIIFGAPLLTKDHPTDAVKSALSIKRELEKVKLGGEEVKMRTGINTGVCLVGGIEAGERVEYTVIGDVVNIASRLQEIASPGQVLIGEGTWKIIRGSFKTKYVGTISLRGKKAKTRIYEVSE